VVQKGATLMMKAGFQTEEAARARAMLPGPMLTGEEFSAGEPRFPTPLACRIARVEAATVRSWGRKYGLMKWSEHEKRNAGILWSVMDLFQLRLMAVMVSMGIHPMDAAWRIGTDETPERIILENSSMFVLLIEDPSLPSIMVFTAGGTKKNQTDRVTFHFPDPKMPISKAYEDIRKFTYRTQMSLIDLRDIIDDVETQLAIKPVVSK